MKKVFITVATIAIFFTNVIAVYAHEVFWHDRNVGFTKFAKIVLFPLSNNWEAMDKYHLGGEGTLNFSLNSYFSNRLTKKMKKVNFIQLSDEIKEFGDINKNTLGHLLNAYPNEEARATAVEEATMADAYIVPRFRENRVQEDISPRREWDIQLKSWTEEKDGPNGNRTYNEKTRVVHHVIPEKKIYLHIMQVEFTGYDNQANKIMTSLQQDRRYGVSQEGQFRILVDDFQKAFTEAKSGKNNDKGKAGVIRIGFLPTVLNVKEPDHFVANAMNFALQELALKRIKNAKINLDDKSALPMNYHIFGVVNNCDLIPVWHDPRYSIRDVLVKSEETVWKDKDGNEHKMKTNYYDQEIDDHYAFWSFYWSLKLGFALIDQQQSIVFTKVYSKTDDKPLDAFRHAADDFCKEVNKQLKGK